MSGIWKYNSLFSDPVEKKYQLTLQEGDTPLTQLSNLSRRLGLDSIQAKREDINPTGSFKDRSFAYWLSSLQKEDKKQFVISSSGNAAISAMVYLKKIPNSYLTIFLHPSIPEHKRKRIEKFFGKVINVQLKENVSNSVSIIFSTHAKSESIQYARENNAFLLRSSVDDDAIEGYKTISFELIKYIHDFDSIFICCSSGTSTIGIFEGFEQNKKKCPPIFIVQTTKVHPIADVFSSVRKRTATSLCTAVSDRVAHRKNRVVEIVKKTKGFGIIIDDDSLIRAQELLKEDSINVSFDGAASLAGLITMKEKSPDLYKTIKKPLLIISGK